MTDQHDDIDERVWESTAVGTVTRRTALKVGLAVGTGGLAGCSAILDNDDPAPSVESTTETTTTSTETTTTTTETTTIETTTREPLEGQDVYFNWIHGEDDDIAEAAPEELSFDAIDQALEDGIDEGRTQALGNALKAGSQSYFDGPGPGSERDGTNEEAHRHIMSAIHQLIDEKTGDEWDFDIYSNMNYTQVPGETIQYSEIKVETGDTTDDGHKEYAIINAALNPDTDHAVHIPGTGRVIDGERLSGYELSMWGVRESANDTDLPPHDVEAIQERVDEGAPESWFPGFAELMGYQLFDGGHSVENGTYMSNEILVPASREIHEKIDEIGYEQGDETGRNGHPKATHGRMDLQLAINKGYFNEGFDETDNPVVIDNLEETEEGWRFDLYEMEDWDFEQGYPAEVS